MSKTKIGYAIYLITIMLPPGLSQVKSIIFKTAKSSGICGDKWMVPSWYHTFASSMQAIGESMDVPVLCREDIIQKAKEVYFGDDLEQDLPGAISFLHKQGMLIKLFSRHLCLAKCGRGFLI